MFPAIPHTPPPPPLVPPPQPFRPGLPFPPLPVLPSGISGFPQFKAPSTVRTPSGFGDGGFLWGSGGGGLGWGGGCWWVWGWLGGGWGEPLSPSPPFFPDTVATQDPSYSGTPIYLSSIVVGFLSLSWFFLFCVRGESDLFILGAAFVGCYCTDSRSCFWRSVVASRPGFSFPPFHPLALMLHFGMNVVQLVMRTIAFPSFSMSLFFLLALTPPR